MSTLTSLTGTSSAVSTTSYTINDDLTINKDNQKAALVGTIISAASTTTTNITQSISNINTTDRIRMQYTKSYIDSMSDKELEFALNKLNLIEVDNIEFDVKKI